VEVPIWTEGEDMKVELNTKEKSVCITANEIGRDLATLDCWIKSLKVAREWLRKELQKSEGGHE
jgi:hypothetical protein